MTESDNTQIEEKVRLAADAADDTKARDIVLMDLRGICDFTDAFMICTGTSSVQIRSIARSIQAALKEHGFGNGIVDGADSSLWVVLDYGDIVIHILDEQTRDYYRLETLWGDAKPIEWESKIPASPSMIQDSYEDEGY
ncbi:MAG: ribosome silencing factor [Candidatus Sumerlaeia bacterium]|nr:ribosome silencing factor [Candidatus Sumerlaeia bacterium]